MADMAEKGKKKKNIIVIILSSMLLVITIFLLWFFNRKFNVVFDLNNGTNVKIVQVKYNKTINEKDIETKNELGESFVNWYEVTTKDGEEVLSDKAFNFKTKINKNIKLKALYEKKETITITFDTKGGSNIDNITISKDTELTLPQEPTLEGYVFKGWVDKNETPIYNKVLLAEDTTLYAVWEKVENKKDNPKTENSKTNTSTNNNNNNNKLNQNANNKTNINNNENTILHEEKLPVVEKTQAERNDEYRKQLQNEYSVKIAYKNELGNYSINGYGSDDLNDDNEINTCLVKIDKTLKNYPNDFFKEMKDYGMPLTIYLVKSISGNVSGLTDAQYKNDIKIMIEPASLFENTLNHEIMHYIDSYISVIGYPIDINTTMKDVNPVGFIYGDTSNEYVYYFTSADNAYFISSYGKTNYLEDRAVIFSDLMTRTFTKDYYADGTPINKKAKLISLQIKEHYKSLSNTRRYYWDRFL